MRKIPNEYVDLSEDELVDGIETITFNDKYSAEEKIIILDKMAKALKSKREE